jgi:Na+/H+ antiporter NhaC
LIVAFSVGSSWTAAATLGVAMIGIGKGLGIPAPMTAGAVLSGAYAGDKNSPLSDTSNLSAAVTNTELMTHVRTMRAGTVVAFGVSLAAFVLLGLEAGGAIPSGRIADMQATLSGAYVVTPLTLLPLVVTFTFALYGYPALPSLTAGVFAGIGVSVVLQGTGFSAAWTVAWSGTEPAVTGALKGLLTSSGVQGSMGVIGIVIAALTLGGVLESTGVLATLAHYIGKAVRSVAGLTAGTVASTISMNFLAADQYIAIVVPGMTLRNLYDEYDLESRNLSRALQASGTTTSAFVPWGSGGVFMAATLGVPVVKYAPFYLFGFLNPLVLLFMGATGWKIFYKDREETEPSAAGRPSPPPAE